MPLPSLPPRDEYPHPHSQASISVSSLSFPGVPIDFSSPTTQMISILQTTGAPGMPLELAFGVQIHTFVGEHQVFLVCCVPACSMRRDSARSVPPLMSSVVSSMGAQQRLSLADDGKRGTDPFFPMTYSALHQARRNGGNGIACHTLATDLSRSVTCGIHPASTLDIFRRRQRRDTNRTCGSHSSEPHRV
jgi:hypothetical protein